MMSELSAQSPHTPNLGDSSPLGTLIRRTSSRRVRGKPANLELMPTPPHAPASAPHSPILHTSFRGSTATSVSYEDGASMRTISWDARTTGNSSNYDLESITNRYRDTWRSSGVVEPPTAYDVPDVPNIPTVVVSAAPEPQPWEQEYAVPGPSKGGRVPSQITNSVNFSRPVQPASPEELEQRKREVLMRNARGGSHSRTHAPSSIPSQSTLPSPRLGTSPPGFPGRSSRPVSPTSPSASQGQTPTFGPSHGTRVVSGQSVYSDYSYYELPPSPNSATAASPQFPSSPLSPAETHPPNTPLNPGAGALGRSATKSKIKAPNPALENPQTPQDYLQLGIQHHLENRLTESAAAFEKSATLSGGCGVGMLMWGLAQRHGWGCEKNEQAGFRWLRRAAELAVSDLEKDKQGDMSAVKSELVLAIYEVGQSFFRGWGVQKDKEMAVQYYRVAARLGDPDAQQELAFCLLNGKGCKKDKKESAKWYRAAVQQGVSDVGLAWIYKEKYQ